VQYDVKNTRPDPMYFSIGSHPALRVPFAGGYLDNYYLRLGLFDQGVLIFKNLRSRVVSIRNSRNARAVSISTGGVPFMDVWAKPGRCPFLCLEPWSGLLDSPSATGELSQKEGILRLELGGEFTSTYRIEIA
jgi:galactose mutarotase-like enzyme